MSQPVVTKISDTESLVCTDIGMYTPCIAHIRLHKSSAMVVLAILGSQGISVDNESWPGFVAMVNSVDAELQRLKTGTA
jgi:hypothetical protein